MRKTFSSFLLIAIFFSVRAFASLGDSNQQLDGGSGGDKVRYSGAKQVSTAPAFRAPMQCIVKGLAAAGYRPKEIGCFGSRPNNRSAHPTGHACDVDQTSRDKAAVNSVVSPGRQSAIAQQCQAVSGCSWGDRDCGHFEARGKKGYVDAGTRPGSAGRTHRYSKKG